MTKDELFAERVVCVERPSAHFTLLRAPDGAFLGADDNELATFDYVDDKAIWEQVALHSRSKTGVEGCDAYRHVVTGLVLEAEVADSANGQILRHDGVPLASDGTSANEGAMFSVGHGPAHLPSESLETLLQNGWVCLASVIAPEIVLELEQISCTGRWENETYDRSKPSLNQSSAVAKVATEPVSLWLMRQYMQTHEIRL